MTFGISRSLTEVAFSEPRLSDTQGFELPSSFPAIFRSCYCRSAERGGGRGQLCFVSHASVSSCAARAGEHNQHRGPVARSGGECGCLCKTSQRPLATHGSTAPNQRGWRVDWCAAFAQNPAAHFSASRSLASAGWHPAVHFWE